MGIVKKFKGRPITGATRPQNRPANIRQGSGGPAAQSQISGPAMPFQSSRNALNLPAGNGPQKGVGDGRSRNAANVSGRQPYSNEQVMRGVGYKKPTNFAGYAVHQPGKIKLKTKPLVAPMTDKDFRDAEEGHNKYRIL
jgi:hypothetical protein